MIVLPKRSVTRFFIPLIDVLILLFCIYLIMPIVEPKEGASPDLHAMEARQRQLEDELARIKSQGGDAVALQKQLDELKQRVGKSIKDRLAVRILEIDAKTGKLFYYDPDRVEIKTDADAAALIDRDRRERGVGQRELFYLILYPRDRTSLHPTVDEFAKFQRWFAGVALGFDIPGEIGEGGSRP